jgi:hypothetical protein
MPRNNGQKRCLKNRKEYIRKLKDVPCADCHKKYPYYIMHFDHRDAKQKSFNISQAASRSSSKEKLELEIKKCDIICSNCHAEREYQRRSNKTVPSNILVAVV